VGEAVGIRDVFHDGVISDNEFFQAGAEGFAEMNFSRRVRRDLRRGASVSIQRASAVAPIRPSASSLPLAVMMAARTAWPGESFFRSWVA